MRKAGLFGYILIVAAVVPLAAASAVVAAQSAPVSCTPTVWAEIGPFYRPQAPLRNFIGTGYEISGTVRSSADCRPLRNARIEIWQAGPGGVYSDGGRATLFTDKGGRFRLRTFMPSAYGNQPPHIHMLVDAAGYEGLITKHYPKKGAQRATIDLVIVPEGKQVDTGRNPMGR